MGPSPVRHLVREGFAPLPSTHEGSISPRESGDGSQSSFKVLVLESAGHALDPLPG